MFYNPQLHLQPAASLPVPLPTQPHPTTISSTQSSISPPRLGLKTRIPTLIRISTLQILPRSPYSLTTPTPYPSPLTISYTSRTHPLIN